MSLFLNGADVKQNKTTGKPKKQKNQQKVSLFLNGADVKMYIPAAPSYNFIFTRAFTTDTIVNFGRCGTGGGFLGRRRRRRSRYENGGCFFA